MKKTNTEPRKQSGFQIQISHILSTEAKRKVEVGYRIDIQNSWESKLCAHLYRKLFDSVL